MRFYAAELILALEHIHAQNIVYRDLKVCQSTVDQEILNITNAFCYNNYYDNVHALSLAEIRFA